MRVVKMGQVSSGSWTPSWARPARERSGLRGVGKGSEAV